MDINRRDAMKVAAAAVAGIVTVKAGDARQLLVIAFHERLPTESMNAMREQLTRLGVEAVLINAAPSEVAIANQKRTFFSLANNDFGRVVADGREVHAVWCDTESGLCGLRVNDGTVEVIKCRKVEFFPRSKGTV